MRKWFEPAITAWTGVVTHKLRSFLTILGIVIGVGAVIALMSVGKGAEAQVLANIKSLGSNLITINPGFSGFSGGKMMGTNKLTLEDAEYIEQDITNIAGVAPSYSSGLELAVGDKSTNAQVTGTTPEYLAVNNLKVASGTFFTENDYESSNRVVVLGPNVAETLFGSTSPIGQQIRMGTIIVRVIGVLQSKGTTFGSPDDGVFMPLTAMQQTVAQPRTAQGDRMVSNISLTVTDESSTQSVITSITSLLRNRHQLSSITANDFNIMSTEEIASTLTETIGTMTLLLGAIAAISLLVGGIGVMNIMLVSVLERTREIGIRKALGARDRDIWSQFLVEAAFLTLAGGIVGIAVGCGVSYIINQVGLIATLVTPDIVMLAVSVSVGIGLFFGFYPAWSAARLSPIEALRSE
jgi:putative ABC transport system permease protein